MAKNKELLFVVDANNRAHAAYHAYKRLSYKGRGVSIIYGLPSMMKSLIWQFYADKMVLVWDGEKSKHRLKLLPEYKSHRLKNQINYNFDREDFLKQKAVVQKLFYYLGIPQVLNPDQEADDMIYKIVKNGKKTYDLVMIVSGDKDFHQLLDGKKVTIWNDARKDEITEENIQTFKNSKGQILFPYKAHQTVDYLTLVGDDSDDIKGYPGIGPTYAMELLNKYGTLEEFIDSGDKFRSIERTKLLEIKNRNTQLIDLSWYYQKYKEELKIQFYKGESNPKIQKDKFQELAAKFNMQKLLAKDFLDEFINLKLNQE